MMGFLGDLQCLHAYIHIRADYVAMAQSSYLEVCEWM